MSQVELRSKENNGEPDEHVMSDRSIFRALGRGVERKGEKRIRFRCSLQGAASDEVRKSESCSSLKSRKGRERG